MAQSDSSLRGFLRDLAFLLGLPLVGLIALIWFWKPWPHPYDVPEGSDIFQVVTGSWAWEDKTGACGRYPHTIQFSPDHALMLIAHSNPIKDSTGAKPEVTEYEIREHDRRHIRGFIRGEKRTTSSGKPVVWDLVLMSPDTYRWHRTDWFSPWAYTGQVRRCPLPAGSTP
jgi:hypothetical protein